MGHSKEKYLRKVARQIINKKENQAYYQNGGEWKGPATDRERSERRASR